METFVATIQEKWGKKEKRKKWKRTRKQLTRMVRPGSARRIYVTRVTREANAHARARVTATKRRVRMRKRMRAHGRAIFSARDNSALTPDRLARLHYRSSREIPAWRLKASFKCTFECHPRPANGRTFRPFANPLDH